ncbi:ATP-dependent RNA helicase [Candidatus Marinamargulisbacteria bacterium SCGC AAA071-K20]|nr:ATP-dependent RNA helicase [Candidatus Marinamargulisbacteria bacterium SCGC AAA071-K20]
MSFIKKIKSFLGKKKTKPQSKNQAQSKGQDRSDQYRSHKPRTENTSHSRDRHYSRRRDNSQSEQKKPPPTVKKEPRKPFTELGLDARLIAHLNKNKFFEATKVQEKSIPIALEGKNIFCSSETGSGKTLSFLLPMIHQFYNKKIDQALILCPTREIAIQTKKVLDLFKDEFLNPGLVIGGTDMFEQKRILKTYPNILVATPGRLLDMLGTGMIWLEHTQYVVLDEADRMLDMGFEEDLIKIKNQLTGNHQILLYSATLFPEVKKMASRYAADYQEIKIGNPGSIAGTVEHVLVEISDREKFHALEELISQNRDKMIVFFNTIRETDNVNKSLRRRRLKRVDCIHSKRAQETREQLISDFRANKLNVLLASDVAARGIDIPNVELVVNYDLPNNAEEYIHRVGRTGRAGKSGIAISFYSPKDEKYLLSIEKLIKCKIIRKKSIRDVMLKKRYR